MGCSLVLNFVLASIHLPSVYYFVCLNYALQSYKLTFFQPNFALQSYKLTFFQPCSTEQINSEYDTDLSHVFVQA